MMNNKNLIMLIEDFQINKNPNAFNQVFESFQLLVRNLAKKYGRNCPILFDEITSELNERIWRIVENFVASKTQDVVAHFKIHLSRAAIDITRKRNGTYVKRRIPLDTTAEENAATFESGEAIRIEEYVISRIEGEIKTDQDKRQLIEALTKNSDALTTAIVKEHLSSEQPSARQIGRKLGVHHYTVTREIRKLRKNYDASLHGELNAFLAV
ncbi:sigma factor [Bacillus atrophaeus]|uniref:sigma factor n=1 Tax=Bacillus atrophaeus TaxID=1452 RepID=UPI001C632668|nr:sigma factor [Bacillus atrophaeus]QYG88302.1 sigma-70 family RNA polymerase sigma factor [Bacillus atrophaeus]